VQTAAPNETAPTSPPQSPKPRRKVIALLAAAIVLIGIIIVVAFFISSSSEPEYQGVTLSKWLERYNDNVDADPQRSEAAEAVRHIGSNAVPTLVRWAGVPDSPFKEKLQEWASKQSLININFTSADDYHERATLGFQLLGAQAKSAIPDLQRLLCNTNSTDTAAEILCALGPDAVPALLSGLTNADSDIRVAAAEAISDWNRNAELPASPTHGRQIILSVPILLNLLQDSEPLVNEVGIRGLGEAGSRKAIQPQVAVPLLIQQLKGPYENCRDAAAEALINFGPDAKDAIPVLLDIIQNGSNLGIGPVMIATAGTQPSLMPWNTPGSSFTVQIGQTIQSQMVLSNGAANLVTGPVNFSVGTPLMPTTKPEGGYVVHALQALRADPAQVVGILQSRLQSPDVDTRYWAVAALGSYGPQAKSSVPALLRLSAGQDANFRQVVFRALEKIDSESARANFHLLDIDFQDSKLVQAETFNLLTMDPFVKRVAAYRLGNFGPAAKSATGVLLMALREKDEAVRAAAAEALKKIDPEAAKKAGVK
jgi:HEAT repeat protein